MIRKVSDLKTIIIKNIYEGEKMKKLIALTLALVSIFALCACGETAAPAPAEPVVTEKIVEKTVEVEVEVPVVPEEYVKYQDLIDALEAEDYESAYKFIYDMVPVPPVTEVEITSDNFFDYFELKMDFEPGRYVEKDSNGKVTAFSMRSGYVLKDEYRIATDQDHQSNIEVGVKYKQFGYVDPKKSVNIDFDNFTYKVTAKKADWTENMDQLVEGFLWGSEDGSVYYCVLFNASTYMTNKKNYSVNVISEKSIEFQSASGTLYLYEEASE